MNIVKEELKCVMCKKTKKRVKFLLDTGAVGKTCLECRIKNKERKRQINEDMKENSKFIKGKDNRIKNTCLKCNKEFEAKSKFNRICNNCKESVNNSTFYF